MHVVALKLGSHYVYQLATDCVVARLAGAGYTRSQGWARYDDMAPQAPKRVLAPHNAATARDLAVELEEAIEGLLCALHDLASILVAQRICS